MRLFLRVPTDLGPRTVVVTVTDPGPIAMAVTTGDGAAAITEDPPRVVLATYMKRHAQKRARAIARSAENVVPISSKRRKT